MKTLRNIIQVACYSLIIFPLLQKINSIFTYKFPQLSNRKVSKLSVWVQVPYRVELHITHWKIQFKVIIERLISILSIFCGMATFVIGQRMIVMIEFLDQFCSSYQILKITNRHIDYWVISLTIFRGGIPNTYWELLGPVYIILTKDWEIWNSFAHILSDPKIIRRQLTHRC